MQIPPATSGSWINPAAIGQQASSDARFANTTSGQRSGVDPLTQLEQSSKTGDRDADERYEGPTHHSSNSQHQSSNNEAADQPMLQLPAVDDQPQSTLDLMG